VATPHARGERITARALILGNGALHIPQLPDVPGLASFRGTQFHSARWNHDYDFTGKRVAVIGTGASAIQFVPEIAPKVDQLHVFQRSPPWIVPKRDRPMTEAERWLFERVPGAHWLRRTGLYWLMESRVIGFAFAPRVLELAEQLVKRSLAEQVPDLALRAKLTPEYRLGCKRVLISNDYYPAIQRPNVELVTDPITEVTPTGVRTRDGRERGVDAIVCGTGFRVSEYLSSIDIVGRDGVSLNDAWRTTLRKLPRHHGLGIPEPVPAHGTEHRARPQLDDLHDRGAGALRRSRAHCASRPRARVPRRAPECRAGIPHRARTQDEEHRMDHRLPQLVPDARR